MSDLSTIASLSTAAGTLVLAVATFSAVRSSSRSARVAERALMLGIRPVLIPARADDPHQNVRFGEGHVLTVGGGIAGVDRVDANLYFAISLRNVGAGLAVLHGWHLRPRAVIADGHADPSDFRPMQLDLYIPAGDVGFWQGAIRDPDDALRPGVAEAIDSGDRLSLDLLYGDHEGGQLTISRFGLLPNADANWVPAVIHHWSLDGADPRDIAGLRTQG